MAVIQVAIIVGLLALGKDYYTPLGVFTLAGLLGAMATWSKCPVPDHGSLVLATLRRPFPATWYPD